MGEILAKLDRVQKSLAFMRIATVVLVLAGIGLFIAMWLGRGPVNATTGLEMQVPQDLKVGADGFESQEQIDNYKSEIERFNQSLKPLMANKGDLTWLAVAIGAVTGLMVLSVWLGIGLTIFGLCVIGSILFFPLQAIESTRSWARLFGGLFALSVSFAVIMRGLHLLLSFPGAMFAIARNTVTEATRLKISVIFIAGLLLALAALPGLLDPENQLRYRVQSFLQYSTGGVFWGLALFVVLFSVSTVATEQRDKVIWQTVTKPVAAWQYILGKWLGVVTLSAALLCVSGVGIFLFVEFLRNQPAENEIGPYALVDGGISPDRQWLESQVLTARVAVPNEPRNLAVTDPQRYAELLENYTAEMAKSNASFDPNDPKTRADIAASLDKYIEGAYRTLEGQGMKDYIFRGLSVPRNRNLPVILRFRVDSGANAPDTLLKMTFVFENLGPVVRNVPLGQTQTMTLPPTVIRDDGDMVVRVFNGQLAGNSAIYNSETATFPKEGLIASYSVGSYRVNFVRVIAALWVKLAFLSMAGIFAGTFLSFPVATLVAFLVLAMAESATFLTKALEVFDEYDNNNKIVAWKMAVVSISRLTSSLFKPYGELQPVKKLVDGMLLSWSEVAVGVCVLAIFTAILFALSSAIFARRELAIYSGQ